METAGSQLKKVLIVCTGNTCRSPMAEGWLNRHLAGKGWVAESAGVAGWGGSPASPEAIAVMHEIGIDISKHRSRTLAKPQVDEAAIILAMTAGHQREIARCFPEAAAKTRLVKSFGIGGGRDVADPIGLPTEAYRHTRDELVQALGEFMLDLAERGQFKPES